jgi:hypothetical protein
MGAQIRRRETLELVHEVSDLANQRRTCSAPEPKGLVSR